MTKTISLKAQSRDGLGTGASRAIRRSSEVPGILYGGKEQPVTIKLPAKELTLAYHKGNFFSKLIELELDGKKQRVLAKDLQLNPVTDVIEHADFYRLEKGSKVKVAVPVRCINEAKSPGLKKGGVLNIVRHEVDLVCDPDAIPTHITVDLSGLNIGDSVHISAIALPDGVTPAIKNRDFTVASVAGRGAKE